MPDGQITLSVAAANSPRETEDQLQQRMQQLCRQCWEEEADAGRGDAEIVVNITSGCRQQTNTIVLVASVYGCELIYTDLEPRAWAPAIRAPDPRRQFLRVLPNQMGETFGVVGLHFARDMFTAKSFHLARCDFLPAV